MLKSDCCETTVNGAQRFAKPKERPPGKTEDEDELEDDYDFGNEGRSADPFSPGLALRSFFQQRQQSWIPTNPQISRESRIDELIAG